MAIFGTDMASGGPVATPCRQVAAPPTRKRLPADVTPSSASSRSPAKTTGPCHMESVECRRVAGHRVFPVVRGARREGRRWWSAVQSIDVRRQPHAIAHRHQDVLLDQQARHGYSLFSGLHAWATRVPAARGSLMATPARSDTMTATKAMKPLRVHCAVFPDITADYSVPSLAPREKDHANTHTREQWSRCLGNWPRLHGHEPPSWTRP